MVANRHVVGIKIKTVITYSWSVKTL